MVKQTFVIRNNEGLHLKPAAVLCTEAIKYQSTIQLVFGDTVANAKSVLNVLGTCVKCNDEITLQCNGEDEEEALKNLGRVIAEGLGENLKIQ